MNIDDLVELGDQDELVRKIDQLCDECNWAGLLALRDKCRAASERGKQLWGAAGHAEYRLALEATPEFAATMVDAEPGRFVLGPLPEVVASTHSWGELEEYLPATPHKAQVAYERVVRGEDLREIPGAQDQVEHFGLPLTLQDWEPHYSLAQYKAHDALFPMPAIQAPVLDQIDELGMCEWLDESGSTDALSQLTQTWASGSNGKTTVWGLEGGEPEMFAQLGPEAVTYRIDAKDALAQMAWAGASGGAHGVRSGAAAGRAKLWWALANLAGVADVWPHPAERIGEYVNETQWWTWNVDDISEGWTLRVAVIDPVDRVTFAIDASDRPD